MFIIIDAAHLAKLTQATASEEHSVPPRSSMKTATLISTLACVALALAELAQVSSQAHEKRGAYKHATCGPNGSPYTIRDGFFVMQGAVLTIRNATILCESYTCLSV